MKYEEIVAKVKKAYAKADTALVDEHLAVQVDVTGEGEGAFYIEVADGKINVEPWEYLDHDFKIQCSADEIIAIAEGKKKLGTEVEAGNVYISRNFDKVAVFDLIVAKKSTAGKKKTDDAKTEEKKTVKKAVKKDEAKEKKPAVKKTVKKETTETADKKSTAKKPAAAKVEAKAEVKVEAPAQEASKEKKTSKKTKTEVKA